MDSFASYMSNPLALIQAIKDGDFHSLGILGDWLEERGYPRSGIARLIEAYEFMDRNLVGELNGVSANPATFDQFRALVSTGHSRIANNLSSEDRKILYPNLHYAFYHLLKLRMAQLTERLATNQAIPSIFVPLLKTLMTMLRTDAGDHQVRDADRICSNMQGILTSDIYHWPEAQELHIAGFLRTCSGLLHSLHKRV